MNRHTLWKSLLIAGASLLWAGVASADVVEAERSEMVEVRIRMPDGRVLIRHEPRFAARVEVSEAVEGPELQTGNGKVTSAGRTVTGGSNGRGSSGFGSSGGGGGGGGGSSSGGGGGGYALPGSLPGGGSGPAPDLNGNSAPGGVPVTVYSWDRSSPQAFRNIIQTIEADPRVGTPERLANRIVARIQTDQPQKIALRFWKELIPASRDPFDLSDPVALWQANGFSDGLEPYWRAVAEQLRARGVTPDYLVQDLEVGVRYWHVPEADRTAFFTTLFANRQAVSAHLPPAVFSVSVDRFLDRRDAGADAARLAYDQAAVDMRTTLIRETMHRPFVETYGMLIDHSNYNDMHESFEVPRYNNSPWFETSVHGISAPSSYVVNYGQEGSRFTRLDKHPRWNQLIVVLNSLRSAAANGPVHPWIAPPGYGARGADTWCRANELQKEEWLWQVFMTHCLAMGIDTYILWNPDPRWNPHAVANDRFMDDWFQGKTAHHELLTLPEIPLDADFIETNGVTIQYSSFVQKFGNR